MSGTSFRPPLRGVIYQGDSIVGGVDLNAADESFVDQFNREYALLGLRVQPLEVSHRQAGVADDIPLALLAGGSSLPPG
jgi:hypothetical protein